jgi:hypothetical protein
MESSPVTFKTMLAGRRVKGSSTAWSRALRPGDATIWAVDVCA